MTTDTEVSMMSMDFRFFGSTILTKRHKHRTCVRCGRVQEDGEKRYCISSKHPSADFFSDKYFCSKECLVAIVEEDFKNKLNELE